MTDAAAPADSSRAERHALALLIATVIVGLLRGDDMGRHVPFFPWLDQLGDGYRWVVALSFSWWMGVLLMCTPWFRAGALLAGGTELLRVLGNMPLFSNGRTFDALLLIMVGLSSAASGLRWLRLQYLLLYVGAALNKMVEPDWWNGDFMVVMLSDSWIGDRLVARPEIPVVMGWVSMTIEATIPILLAMPKRRAAGVWLCLTFHSTMLLLLREDFATFFYAVSMGAILLFYPLPRAARLRVPAGLARLLPRTASFSAIRNATCEVGPWALEWGHAQLTGARAAAVLVACSLPAQVMVILAVTTASRIGAHDVREALLCGLVGAGAAAAWQMRRFRPSAPVTAASPFTSS